MGSKRKVSKERIGSYCFEYKTLSLSDSTKHGNLPGFEPKLIQNKSIASEGLDIRRLSNPTTRFQIGFSESKI